MPDDDLLKPTIIETPPPTRPPWRVDSLVYPAFFGGPIAATVLGAINARRLGVDNRKTALIYATGAAALTAQLLVIAFFLAEANPSAQRFSHSLAGVAVWGVAQYLQRARFRVFQLRGGEPAGLLAVGIGAIIASGIIQFVLVTLVISAVT